METRPCNICRRPFPISEYLRRSDGRLINSRCRECNAARNSRFIRTPHGRFLMARGIAKSRGLCWELAEELFIGLISSPCAFCGFPLNETGLGLDRLDSSRGYSPDNVVPCCWECNQVRSTTFTFEEMKLLGAVIASIKQARVDAGLPVSYRENNRGWGRPRKYPKPA